MVYLENTSIKILAFQFPLSRVVKFGINNNTSGTHICRPVHTHIVHTHLPEATCLSPYCHIRHYKNKILTFQQNQIVDNVASFSLFK